MSRNVKMLLVVSVLFGVAGGIYEFVLPYYLSSQGLSFKGMGYIFAASTAVMFLVRIGLGNLADRWGSKQFYLFALSGCTVASLLTPFTASLALLILLKTMREVGVLARDTAHPILLYEENRGRFMDFIGKTRGMEFLFQAAGTLVAGIGMAFVGERGSFWVGGVTLGIALIFLSLGVRGRGARPSTGEKVGSASLFRFDLAKNLKIIMVAQFIFSVGLSTSHCFIMPLFFSEKFGVSAQVVSVVMVIHRLTFISMLIVGSLNIRRLKAVYIGTVAFEGVILTAGAVIPDFFWAAAVWLLHDLFGAAIWIPIQSTIIQEECRDEQRGLDLSKTLAFSALGGAIGPLLAGWLSGISISGPFLVSGILVTLSAGALLKLRLKPSYGV
ncbi:MAG: MFS transporter, partial [Candidatus Latescibacteria bacterium]|nr:MFS transporter [Candidatus Latescibacterota bacterium]